MYFTASEWRIAGSYGETVTVGTPNIQIQVGGSRLSLPLENTRTKKAVTITGGGAGISAGVSGLDTPLTDWINGSISTKDMPSDGIGIIYRKDNAENRRHKAEDFKGALTVISGGVNIAAVSGEVCVAMWQQYPLEHYISEG